MISIMDALNHKRNDLGEREKGFTLIELLVVVIVIGILAAIAIPVYLGVQDNAKDSAIKSDLANAKLAVVGYYTENPTATGMTTPDLLGGAGIGVKLKSYGLTKSDTVTLAFGTVPAGPTTDFCINGTRTGGSKTFSVKASSGIVEGACTTV